MGVLSKLFGSDKAIDAGINGIDKVFYTEEEKADDNIKRANIKMAFLKLYEPFKIAQRFLAMIVGIPFVTIHTVIFMVWLSAIWKFGDSEEYKFISSQFEVMQEMNNATLGEPFAIILFFYFLGGASEGVITKFMAGKKATQVSK